MLAGIRANLRGPLDQKAPAFPTFVRPVVMTLAAVLATTVLLLAVEAQLAAEHLVLGYLLPTIVIAIYYGSTFAVLTSFIGGLAAAYFLFPPKFSFYITDVTHIAELGFFLLLAIIASKAVAVLMDQPRRRGR
jgi:two-component system, OmpR family, sensor histidine kinase KdpD